MQKNTPSYINLSWYCYLFICLSYIDAKFSADYAIIQLLKIVGNSSMYFTTIEDMEAEAENGK